MSRDVESELSAMQQFKLHPEMLPYVGPQYDECRILFIGESHYIGSAYASDQKFCDDVHKHWYEWETGRFNWLDPENDPGWFNTRGVIEAFLTHNRNRAHSMFGNPAKVFCEIVKNDSGLDITDCDAFSCAAFCNYFQRPEIITGATFEPTEEDATKSAEIISQIINILDPGIVVFLSKKAYNAFSGRVDIEGKTNIQCVNHPTSASWNKTDGKEKFFKIMKKYFEDNEQQILPALQRVKEQKLSIIKSVFDGLFEYLSSKGMTIDGYSNALADYYQERSVLPCIDLVVPYKDRKFSLRVEATDNLYYGICAWDEAAGCIKGKPDSTDCRYAEKMKDSLDTYGRSGAYCWWNYLPDNDHKLCFTDRGAEFDALGESNRLYGLLGNCKCELDKLVI